MLINTITGTAYLDSSMLPSNASTLAASRIRCANPVPPHCGTTLSETST